MSRKYKHILSPLKIGNVVLKSRLLSANALPHFLQGPELYPSDAVVDQIHFYGSKVIGATHLNAPAGYGVYDGEPAGGMQAAQDEALTFADVVDTFIIIGDNEGSGNVMTATWSAYAAAMRI